MARASPLASEIEAALGEFAETTTRALAGNLVGIYVEGSFAWGNEVETSDVDLRIVVRESATASGASSVEAAREFAQQGLGREVGVHFDRLPDLMRVGTVRLQRSRWVSGEDIRSLVPLKSIDTFVRDVKRR